MVYTDVIKSLENKRGENMTKAELEIFLKSIKFNVDDLYNAEDEKEKLKYYERLMELLNQSEND